MKVKLTVMLLTIVTRDRANGATGETKGGSWTPTTENTHLKRTCSLFSQCTIKEVFILRK